MFDASFSAFVVGLVVLIFLLSLLLAAVNNEHSESDGDATESEATQQQADQSSYEKLATTIADAIHTYRRYRRADERYRAQREKATIIVLGITAIFAFFAAFAAIYSAVIFSNQLSEMERTGNDTRAMAQAAADQARSAREGNRPWMTTPSITIQKITIDDQQISVLADFVSKNIGHSPAFKVILQNDLSADRGFEADKLAQGICNRIRTAADNLFFGKTVLPSEAIKLTNYSASLDKTKILAIKHQEQQIIRQQLNVAGRSQSEIAEAIASHRRIENYVPSIQIVGCYGYGFAEPIEVHTTGFVLEVLRAPDAENKQLMFDISEERSFEGDQLEISESVFGGRNAD